MVVEPTSSKSELTFLEREALMRAISAERVLPRDALLCQASALHVAARTYTGVGFYTDFVCPEEFRIADPSGGGSNGLVEVTMAHPNGEDFLFFLFYLREGAFVFLEATLDRQKSSYGTSSFGGRGSDS